VITGYPQVRLHFVSATINSVPMDPEQVTNLKSGLISGIARL
jgi:hypothetical protein